MKFKVLFLVLLGFCAQAYADALDELLPRPQIVTRGNGRACRSATAGGDGVAALPGWYRLTIQNNKPKFEGNQLYAKVTFGQLKRLSEGAQIPDCVIEDWPRFKYRGLLLDCGRNYQTISSIKLVIDQLARYKYNIFHWHIVDNYGWRLESKKYPELQANKAFTRDVGKFYTQAEFKEVVAYAKKRGITVIPELDMPGHTLAFRKGLNIPSLASDKAKVILGELIDELCALADKEMMPIIHLGTDEAREPGEKVPQSHLDYWASKVTGNGRQLMGWSPGLKLPGQTIKQLWMGANDPRGDNCGYIDSQNSFYINHVDPEELLSVGAYQQPCRWGAESEKLGAIIGVWHDDAIQDNDWDVIRMNAVFPAIVLLSDSFWRGREKDEPTLYARLPPPEDPRFQIAADLERRTIAQRDKVLKNVDVPFPYVAQTEMRWTLSIEHEEPQLAVGATIYPRHFWFPAAAFTTRGTGHATLKTTIISDREQDIGAWIGMTGFSRSDGRSRDAPTPKLGEWNKHGATIEINGKEIPPPKWTHPGVGGNPKEQPLVDEDYWYREPTKIHLRKGENTIVMRLPHPNGWKWIGTFLPINGTSDHPSEVKGIKYHVH